MLEGKPAKQSDALLDELHLLYSTRSAALKIARDNADDCYSCRLIELTLTPEPR